MHKSIIYKEFLNKFRKEDPALIESISTGFNALFEEAGSEWWREFDVGSSGLISNPGKFENEPKYVPYFYDAWANGMADKDDDSSDWIEFVVDAEDRKLFPELGNVQKVFIAIDDSGFVHSDTEETTQTQADVHPDSPSLQDEGKDLGSYSA